MNYTTMQPGSEAESKETVEEEVVRLRATNAMLRAKVYTLERRLTGLEELTMERMLFPRSWKISATRQDIIRLAMRNHMITVNSIVTVCPRGEESEDARNLAGVHVYHINRRFAAAGLKARLENVRNQGWILTPESKAELREALKITHESGIHDADLPTPITDQQEDTD